MRGQGRAAIVWTPAELGAFLKHCKPQVARAVRLAALTGMRIADVVDLNWSDIEDDVIRRPTSKSRRRQRASIALYPALRQLLEECPKAGPRSSPTPAGALEECDALDSSMRPAITAYRASQAAQGAARPSTSTICAATACTHMFLGGLTYRQISLALAWSRRKCETG